MTASDSHESPGEPTPHRLHGTTLIFRFGKWIRAVIVPGLVVVFLARDETWELWLMLLFIPMMIYEIFRYFTYRYTLGDDEMVLHRGLVFRNERHVPYSRVQNIDLVQNPVHRLLRVATARLETAGGKEPEAVLSVLSLRDIQTLRRRVFAERGAAPGDAEPALVASVDTARDETAIARAGADHDAATTIIRVPTRELFKLGLISNRSMALVLLAVGAAWEFDLFERLGVDERFRTFVMSFDWRIAALILLGLAFLVIAVLIVFSVIWTAVRLHEFRLERSGDDLRMTCGLLTKLSATIPRHRIQKVSVHETIPHRWFGRVTVRVETAGGVSDESEQNFSRKWFLPILPKADVDDVLERLGLLESHAGQPWRPLADGALKRMIKKRLMLAAVAALAIGFLVSIWTGAIVMAAFTLLAFWHARAAHRYLSYARLPTGIAFRSGVLTRKLSTVRFEKMQVALFSQTPFDRRHRMARVTVDTAGAGPAHHAVSVPYLDEQVGRRLFDDLTVQTERSRLRW